MRNALLFGGLALVLLVSNGAIVQKERVLAHGTPVLLELAPVDPRSLMQGDYMRLNYRMSRENRIDQAKPDGRIVITLDEDGVARFVRVYDGVSALAPGQHLLRYRNRSGFLRIGTDAFYFQEGHADRYRGARYGELRVDKSGESVLVGLRDSTFRSLR